MLNIFAMAFSDHHESTMDPRLSHIVIHFTTSGHIMSEVCDVTVAEVIFQCNVSKQSRVQYTKIRAAASVHDIPSSQIVNNVYTFHLTCTDFAMQNYEV